MESQGLTTFALVFMLVSMGSVTGLMVWCFYRILSEPGGGRYTAGPEVGGE